MKRDYLVINTTRDAYSPDSERIDTMTVGELIEILQDLDPDPRIITGHDSNRAGGWYTYGGITARDIIEGEDLDECMEDEDE